MPNLTLPRYLSSGNSPAHPQHGTGGQAYQLKENPWPEPFPGTIWWTCVPRQVRLGRLSPSEPQEGGVQVWGVRELRVRLNLQEVQPMLPQVHDDLRVGGAALVRGIPALGKAHGEARGLGGDDGDGWCSEAGRREGERRGSSARGRMDRGSVSWPWRSR